SHVRFLGAVRRADLPALYASADAFVMPSVTETQGLVLAEAMAAGAHIIAADVPPNREVLGNQGMVVAATPHAFAGAFQTVPPAPLSSAAAAAKEAAAAFSQARATDRMLSLYGSLVRPARVA
ncbi:MAG: glycosyltransferase, partial [Candidatus Eremiobacteraeota bacterium]|nr:glycosyltransferase [Candidatus Eremiobacteraeota bacterium]MBV9263469.1 glycosyltransferase [Candidatus Eremiobacteraeota bacterium]